MNLIRIGVTAIVNIVAIIAPKIIADFFGFFIKNPIQLKRQLGILLKMFSKFNK